MRKPEVIYKDEHLIALNKPSGILSIPDRYDPLKPNLQNSLQKEFEKIWTVHRLDKETSGIIIFALNEDAHRSLSLEFERRKVSKIYNAFVHGKPPIEEGKIEVSLIKRQDGKVLIAPKGKLSISYFRLIDSFRFHSLLDLKLETGRTHQARVHCEYLGCPLIVDPIYGGDDGFYLSSIKRNYNIGKNKEERPLVSRVPLHARKLIFNHPSTGTKMELEAEWPKDLRALHKQLSKWSSTN